MTNRTMYKPLIVLLSLILIFNMTGHALVAGENTVTASVSWEKKIDPYLLIKMEESTEGKIPVWLWMEDIDQNEVEQTVYERTGLREDTLSVIDEPISNELAVSIASIGEATEEIAAETRAEFRAYLEHTQASRALENQRVDTYLGELRAVRKEMHRTKNADTFSKLGIPQENIIETETLAPMYIVYIEKDDVERLAKHPKVTGIYYYDVNAVEVPEDSISECIAASTVNRIRTDTGLTGSGVKVGIIDSGKVQSNTDIASSRITYITIDTSSASYSDHATDVARIAVGSNGVASNALVYSTSGKLADAIASLSAAGVSVANHSMGEGIDRSSTPYTPLEIHIDYLINSERFTLVKSAGNDHSVISSPGLAYNVITVGGFYNQGTADQSDDKMYSGSNYDNITGCFKPDLVADQTFTGTSYAAPFVTGTIALLFQIRPSLKMNPEAVKAILMASCHRKVLPSDGDSTESITSGLTDHQGAGAIDPYMAVAIAGSGHYGVRTMDSTVEEETIRFNQPDYGSDGLNVVLTWSQINSSTTVAGTKIDLDMVLRQGGNFLKGSSKAASSTEMVYITPSDDGRDYEITVDRYSALGTSVRYAYAFSVSDTRYQYIDENEGVFYIRNKANGLYLTRSETTVYQNSFSGADEQQWLIRDGTIYSSSTTNNRLSLGSTISGIYRKVITDTSAGMELSFEPSLPTTELNGAMFILNETTGFALSAYNNSSASGSYAAWSAYSSSNTYQQWYLEPIAYQRGDIDRDNDIDASDALLALQYSVQLVTLSDLQQYLADVNGDGSINATDSQIINQITTQIIS